MALEGRLFRRLGLLSAMSRTFGSATCQIHWLAPGGNTRRNAHGSCLHPSFFSNCPWISLAVRAFRSARADSRNVLWDWRGGECNHRAQRLEADSENAGQGLSPLGPLRLSSDHHGVDAVRDRLAFCFVRIRRPLRKSAAETTGQTCRGGCPGSWASKRAAWSGFAGNIRVGFLLLS